MIFFVLGVWIFLRTLCIDAANVSFENIALRQQLAVLQRSVPRPKVYRRGLLFWGLPSPPPAGRRAHPALSLPITTSASYSDSVSLHSACETMNTAPPRPPVM